MLSIVPLKNAAAATSYYEKDNYYVKGSTEAIAASCWHGNGAALLGLSGYVELETFEKILHGNLPGGIQLGRIENGERKHRPGYDLTYSAPKSVSILAEIGGDKRLITAHDEAVKAALEYFRQDALRTRAFRQGNIVFEKVDNFVAALFRHDTSRKFDPDTHTHAVLMNAVRCQDGKWRSLSSERLHDMKLAGGVVYRAELAKRVQKLGYDIEVTHADGRFDIKGIDEKVLRFFSKRRAEIEGELNNRGWQGAKAAATIAKDSREKKQTCDRSELHQTWQQDCKQLGFNPARVITKAKQRGQQNQRRHTPKQAEKSVLHALKHLSENESVFTDYTIIKEALAFGMGKIVLADVKQAMKSLEKKGLLLTIDDEHWSTPAIKAREEDIITLMQCGQNILHPITGPETIAAFTHNATCRYTRGQIDAMQLILTTTDRFIGIQGDAGTGKTTMLKAVKEIAEATGKTLIGLSPTKDAALVLEEKAGIKSMTIHQFLLTEQSKPNILIVDESSMLGSKNMLSLMELAIKHHIRVIFVGDTKQLSAIEAGKPFHLLQRCGMATTKMREVLRQKSGTALRQA